MVPALSQVPPLAMPLPGTHLVPLGAEPGIILSKFGFQPQNSASGPQFQEEATSHAITLDSAAQGSSDESSESGSNISRTRYEDGNESSDEEGLAQVRLGFPKTPLGNGPFVNYKDEGTVL